MNFKKYMLIFVNVIYHIIRWFTILISGFLLLLAISEIFSYEYNNFHRWEGADSWNYANPLYYKASIILDLFIMPIFLILSIFSYKIPKYMYILIILIIYIAERLIFDKYSVDNPPEWILSSIGNF